MLRKYIRTLDNNSKDDSLAIAGDHKAHFDITVNGDFDQFDRKPIEIISPSVLSPSTISTGEVTQYSCFEDSFESLCARLVQDALLTNSQDVTVRQKVLCALHFCIGIIPRALATGHCVSQQALSKYIKEVTDALTNISEQYIQFPNTTQERNAVKHQCCFIKFIFYKGLCKIDEGMMRDMNAQNRQLQEIILQLLSRGIDLLEGFAQNRKKL
ncbi:hypothetical protein EVAR_90793_1 [Eumeta japonica]|uniref:Uncharacterized protein n=1 Tax=Eumeta variegata TaxID=151549 RepID=A0A4C2AF20_EUMVA|nr:hypothetical protein EVAR_90793_1 [Eumeta japonica]